MPRLTTRRLVRGAQRGFTLTELIVTLSLLSVVGTIVARLMMDQQRFYQTTREKLVIRREMRTALSTIPADLRSISSVGGDISAFDDTQITFRGTYGTAIICAKPNATTLDLPPTNMARTTLATWFTPPAVGDTLFAFRTDSMGAGGDSWTSHRITSVSQDVSYCPASPFIDAVLDAAKARWRVTVAPAVADSVKVGAPIRLVRSTKYELVAAASGNYYLGRAEYTSGAWGASTPIAGPFTAPAASGQIGGLQFTMQDSTGAIINPSGDRRSVSRIDVRLRGRGTSSAAATKSPKDSLVFRIALRNRQ